MYLDRTPEGQTLHCAIYTRQSVEQGSAREFNSLEAQRTICSSYIASQQPKGWTELVKHYDDGGQSGANLARPALQDLITDIESGRIDVIVVYKLDRITRTLLDFVRLMDLFDHYGVGFVAVTQNFDTADSTGRLILNILLTFAQFEREIASDRLKDKFGAMRQRGMFAGGPPPFGYDLVDRKLVVNSADAEVVRWIFNRYLEVQNSQQVTRELRKRGVVRRSRTSRRGVLYKGRFLCPSSVRNMLDNPLYAGEIRHKGQCYPGQQEGIITRQLWEKVQAIRAKFARDRRRHETDLLNDFMYDSFGRKMASYRDYRYQVVSRYYISIQSAWGRRRGVRRYRTRADELERLVVAAIAAMLCDRQKIRGMLLQLGIHDHWLDKLTESNASAAKTIENGTFRQVQCALKALIERIELSSDAIKIIVRMPELPRFLSWDGVGYFRGDVEAWKSPHLTATLDVPCSTICMKRELTLLLKRTRVETSNKPNPRLVALLKKARRAQSALDDRSVYHVTELAAKVGCHPKKFTELVRLNYLAPDIIASILDGTQPAHINCNTLRTYNLPMDWSLQRRLLGFPDQPDFLKAAPGW